jgi:hypothetical protein
MVAQLDNLYLRLRPWKLWSRLVSYALFEGRPLTTRGRWINPLVFAHFTVEKCLPQIKRVEKPVFILGTGRSGTTILGLVLSMHREVGFLNEPKALWHSVCPHEDLIGSYSLGVAHYRLDENDASHDMMRSAHRLFGAYLVATLSRRVVDKYPELIFRVPFVKALFPDARFLFLVRNGWDTCHSIESWSNRLGEQVADETHDWWGADRRKWNFLIEQVASEHPDLAKHVNEMRSWTNQTDMAAVEWIITMREGLRLLHLFPNDVMRFDYEELCRSPRQQFSRIVSFLELRADDEPFLRYAEQTLKPTPDKAPFVLSPLIEEPFRQTMLKLGYGCVK